MLFALLACAVAPAETEATAVGMVTVAEADCDDANLPVWRDGEPTATGTPISVAAWYVDSSGDAVVYRRADVIADEIEAGAPFAVDCYAGQQLRLVYVWAE